MDGPPILGPRVMEIEPSSSKQQHDDNRIDGGGDDTADQQNTIIEASPLWEHTEAFRRAVILGLVFDEDNYEYVSNSIFSDVITIEGKPINVRGGSEDDDLVIAAAVEAGLLLPSSTRGGGGGGTNNVGSSHRVRGGGVGVGLSAKKSYQQKKNKSDEDGSSSSSKPFTALTSWFIREISAPLEAIPAWNGLVCSYLREKKEEKLRRSSWCLLSPRERIRYVFTGQSSGKRYDASKLDFGSSVSATAQVPCSDVLTTDGSGHSSLSLSKRTVRVKAFAPNTFRDLRNKCFHVSEQKYARSILNSINNGALSSNGNGEQIMAKAHDDTTISNVLRELVSGQHQQKSRIRRSMQSLPYISFQSNSKGAARVGTFFFFTADGAYMIKTIKKEEGQAFLEMLPEYHRFMSDSVNSRNSLLTRIFGMYSVQFPSGGEADAQSSVEGGGDRWAGGLFTPGQSQASNIDDEERLYIVMHSCFPSKASTFVTERFDLKGSTVGRECSLEEIQTKGANAVRKDLNLMREVEEEIVSQSTEKDSNNGKRKKLPSRHGIHIGQRKKMALMAQLERDVDLLHRCSVLDYSLLVGVADMGMPNQSVKKSLRPNNTRVPKSLQHFFHWMDFPLPYYGADRTPVDGGSLSTLRGTRKGRHVVYYMSVIDFLQPWTVKKRLERDLKGLAGYDKSAISCVAPSDYASRFLKFVNAHVT